MQIFVKNSGFIYNFLIKILTPVIIIMLMKNKHIYIDESGSYMDNIIICFIIFFDIKHVESIDFVIDEFKSKSNRQNTELHFNRESLDFKKNFFKCLPKDKFDIKYSLYKNNRLSNIDLIVKSLIENSDIVKNSFIFIDGLKIRKYNRKVISSIKKELKKYNIHIKSIKYIDSKNSNLIQLADMCAGCIRRKFERNRKEDNELFNLIKFLIDI